jgi:uncharacterized protein (UPF0332 family)
MKNLDEMEKEDRIKSVSDDKAKAKNLIKRSRTRYENQLERDLNDNTVFEILENVYECIREAIEAVMSLKGYKSEDHVASIAFAEEKMDLDRSEVNKLHRFRKLRNESRYEAKEITEKEVEDIIEFADRFIPRVEEEVEDML